MNTDGWRVAGCCLVALSKDKDFKLWIMRLEILLKPEVHRSLNNWSNIVWWLSWYWLREGCLLYSSSLIHRRRPVNQRWYSRQTVLNDLVVYLGIYEVGKMKVELRRPKLQLEESLEDEDEKDMWNYLIFSTLFLKDWQAPADSGWEQCFRWVR